MSTMKRAALEPNYHLGHFFIDCMKKNPDAICQIDAATGEQETNASVLKRSIRLARCFRKLGLKPGDVLALGGRNHLDIFIPYYAALMTGLPIVGVDPMFKFDEIKKVIKVTQPKIAFCQEEHYKDYARAAEESNLDTKIFTFDGESTLADILDKYDDNSPIEDFQPTLFDLDKVYAWLISTGGTTGIIKFAAFKHKTWFKKLISPTISLLSKKKVENERKNGLHISPIQWISAFYNPVIMPLTNQTRVQSSLKTMTTEVIIDMINKYKPVSVMMGPPTLAAMLKSEKQCDFSCFHVIIITGGKLFPDVLAEVRKKSNPDALIFEIYGQTENLGPVFFPNPMGPIGNCGRRSEGTEVKLVDPETGKEITEPHVPGELWSKGAYFSEYYNNPEETANAFTEDGWYKSGDLLYRDEADNFFFVERLKLLIKYKSNSIAPPELEEVIRQNPGVYDVSVTSIPHDDDGELPVACVVRNKGSTVTAQEIKDLVANKLSENKQLRGGVVFLDALPMTSAGKIARSKLKEIVLTANRE